MVCKSQVLRKVKNMKKTLLMLVVIVALLSLVVLPSLALASDINTGIGFASETGLGSTDIRTTISRIINVAMGLLGIVAVLIILLGGFKWMTAGGADEKIKEARKLIMSGIIGLVIILAAYAIATFVVGSIVNAT